MRKIKEGIRSDSLSLSTYYLRLIFKQDNHETEIATGTGFMYQHDDYLYLITNGHNVTGVNPETSERISSHAGIPNLIKSKARIRSADSPNMVGTNFFDVDLYEDFIHMNNPKWYIHPVHGYKVDVIAIPICSVNDIPKHVLLSPINRYSFDFNPPEVGDDVFVLGYPFNLNGSQEMPIWKRGSIATEPYFDLDSLPKILIDTATRPGMSGSPVIFQRIGLIDNYIDENTISDISIGTIRGFLGIYSGRIGSKDELQAQLGIVWKKKVIDEIVLGKVLGNTSP